jgi:hypothetical protein
VSVSIYSYYSGLKFINKIPSVDILESQELKGEEEFVDLMFMSKTAMN